MFQVGENRRGEYNQSEKNINYLTLISDSKSIPIKLRMTLIILQKYNM